ncbi:MAG: HAMP domain-containing histidine kinase [Eubacteriales bacterium]|nr:HAMP domain-containing histidine kinase [Eubacteriales bacterium]
MFKSVFSRTIFIYFVIIIVIFSLIGVYTTVVLQRNIYEENRDQIVQEAHKIDVIAEDGENGKISDEIFYSYLLSSARQVDGCIWILSDEAAPMFMAEAAEKDKRLVQQANSAAFNEDMYAMLDGNVIEKTGYYLDADGSPVLTVGVPRLRDGEVVGVILIHSPMKRITATYDQMFPRLWASVIIATLVGIIAISLSTYRIINPVLEMNNAARDIARGKLDTRVRVSSHDEIGQLAESFNKMADELSKTDDLRKSFVANVSHELRSPLTSIIGFVQGIRDGTIAENEREFYLDIVLEESKRLTRLIRDLLDLAQIESGQFPLNRTVFDINELTARTLVKQSSRIEEKGLDVQVDFAAENIKTDGDAERIAQVLTNLIDNAIKYVDDNKRIRINTRRGKDGKVIVGVENSGMLPEQEMDRIFDRFYIGDKARSPGAGTGLGLSIVRRIIHEHGEDVFVENTDDGFVRFSFSLPGVKSEEHIKTGGLNNERR